MRSKNEEYFRQIETFIDVYRDENAAAPTVMEISAALGIPKTTVGRYLAYMREQGMLEYSGHRNIQTRASKLGRGETLMTPVLGRISCGLPKFAEENIEEYVRLPVALFGRGDFYILRASGDSMIDAGIDDGDLVLIRMQDHADEGQIVVALIEDEATLKRYYIDRQRRCIRLHPENPRLEDIYVSQCQIQGVAVKVLKDL